MRRIPKGLAVGLAICAIAMVAAGTLLAIKWPFRRSAILKALREEANGEVTIGGFTESYFPQPGCTATGVVIHHGPNDGGPPLITVERLVIRGDYSALITLRKRLDEVRAEGMHIVIRRGGGARDGGGGRGSGGDPVPVRRFVAERTVLEFEAKKAADEPFVLQIHRTELAPASAKTAMSFHAALAIPEPPGEVVAEGSFGPWREGDAFQTPVSGSYRFEHANLGEFKGLAGILGSGGKFSGTLAAIDVSGDTDVQDFEIEGTGHRLRLGTAFHAMVNGQTGDVRLLETTSRFLHTAVRSEGAIASPSPGLPKNVSLNMAVTDGRVQDLLRLVSSGPPGLTGAVSLRLKVKLPPGEGRFLEKLRLTGEMGVGNARFTKRETQEGLERISRNAENGTDNPADVISDLKGRVSVSNGVATLSGVMFDVPGASAAVAGTYHLITHRLELHGQVRLEEKLSQTTTGVKSFLLKALDPFFRKKKHLSVIPIRISGREGKTSISLDPGH